MKSKWEKFTTVYKAYVLSVQENRQLVIAMISLVCATTLLSFFTPVLSGLIIDAVERQSTPLLEYLCILSMVVLTVSAIVSLFQNHIVSKCITRVSYEMKKKAFRASLSRHSSFYDRFKFGEILFRIYNDTAVVAEKIILLPVNFLVSVAFLIIAVFSIALINKIVFLFVVAMLLANSLISVWLQKKGKHRSQSLQEKGEALYALSQDQLANVESIQLCCFAEKEASRNDAAMRGFAEQYYKKNVYFGNSGVALSVANSLWTTGILLIGGYAIVAKTMTLGDLVYCLMLMNILMPFCKNIQEFILYQSTYLMMLDRHNEIVHYPAIDFGKKSDTNPIRTGSVLISSVRFSYPGVEKTVFDNGNVQFFAHFDSRIASR